MAEQTAISLLDEKRERDRRLDGVLLAFGAIAIIALAYFVRSIVNPFVGLVVLYIVLYPAREYRAARRLLSAGGALFAIWFVYTLSGVLVPFALEPFWRICSTRSSRNCMKSGIFIARGVR